MAKAEIITAIQQAASALGRAPSRGELKRITGVSHYRVLADFSTLRDAVRAAGLEPNPKGQRISTGDLLQDWKRVANKLGKKPSRSAYMREGKYSAGTFTARFGSWGQIGANAKEAKFAQERKTRKPLSREATRIEKSRTESKRKAGGTPRANGVAGTGDKVLAMKWATSMAQLPGELAGKRRVTEAVAALVVNTLLGPAAACALFTATGNQSGQARVAPVPSLVSSPRPSVSSVVNGMEMVVNDGASSCLRRDRPVMGRPFDLSPLTNAPINELGVVFLFGIVAGDLGFQVESLQGRFPDCEARREIHPGKWQRLRIEFEYESKNFFLHGHDPQACDVIICWRHNWRECPESLEVLDLSRIVGGS